MPLSNGSCVPASFTVAVILRWSIGEVRFLAEVTVVVAGCCPAGGVFMFTLAPHNRLNWHIVPSASYPRGDGDVRT